MKKGCNPNKSQSIMISNAGLNMREWLIIKDMPNTLVIKSRNGDKIRKYNKIKSNSSITLELIKDNL